MLKNNIGVGNRNIKKKVANVKDYNFINRLNLSMKPIESKKDESMNKTRNYYNVTTDGYVGAVQTKNKKSNKMANISITSNCNRNDSQIKDKTLKFDKSFKLTKHFDHKRNYSGVMQSLSLEKKSNYLQIHKNSLKNEHANNNTIIKSRLNTNQVAINITRNSKKIDGNMTAKTIFEMNAIPELDQTSKLNSTRMKPFSDTNNKVSIKDNCKIPHLKKLHNFLNSLNKTVKSPIDKNTSSKTVTKREKEKENNISVFMKKTVNVNRTNNINKKNNNEDKLKDKFNTMTLNLKNTCNLNKNFNKNITRNKNTNLNPIVNGKPDVNIALPNKIQKNLKSVRSLQVLPSLNKNKKVESLKTNDLQSSLSIYIKPVFVKPIYNKSRVIPLPQITRSFDQFNLMNLNNLSKIAKSTKNIFNTKLRKNTSELNLESKSLLKSSLLNNIDIINTSKLDLHDRHNSISNCSLGSFSLIHEKSELNSALKQEKVNDFKLDVEAADINNIEAVEFIDYEDTRPQADEDAIANEYKNNIHDEGEEENVETQSGALTLDQVKDIIVYFDFNEFDLDDKNLFFENDLEKFEENTQNKYRKYFFTQNPNNSVIDDTSNISPSTKDSSSYRRITIV